MTSFRPLDVLIVEDEALLAMELESLVEQCGHSIAGWATSAPMAIELADSVSVDLAFVDIQLKNGTNGIEVADYLQKNNACTVVFITADPRQIPSDFVGAAGVIAKPYTGDAMLNCVAYLEEAIRRPPPTLLRPQSFNLAPDFKHIWSPA